MHQSNIIIRVALGIHRIVLWRNKHPELHCQFIILYNKNIIGGCNIYITCNIKVFASASEHPILSRRPRLTCKPMALEDFAARYAILQSWAVLEPL